MNIWYRLSLLCGLIPLILGVVILLTWINTRASWLETAGVLIIVIGVALFICGLFCLLFYVRSNSTLSNPVRKRKLILPLSILLLNFPAAILSLLIADSVYSTSTVTVQNNSNYEITEIWVEQRGGKSYSLPSVQPRKTHVEKIRFTVESDVLYSLSINGSSKQGVLFGYVSPGAGYRVRILVNSNGMVEIEEVF